MRKEDNSMRDYELEEFLMHYGVPGMKRPRGLKYRTRGSTSLYANRRAQMYRKNTESEESSREKEESDAAAKKIKNAVDNMWTKQKSKKSKSTSKKDFFDRVRDEQTAKLARALENETRNRYKHEWHKTKMVQDVDNTVKPVRRTKTQNKKFNKIDKYVRR